MRKILALVSCLLGAQIAFATPNAAVPMVNVFVSFNAIWPMGNAQDPTLILSQPNSSQQPTTFDLLDNVPFVSFPYPYLMNSKASQLPVVSIEYGENQMVASCPSAQQNPSMRYVVTAIDCDSYNDCMLQCNSATR